MFVQHMCLNASVIAELQWKPLNVISLGQTKSDNINRMISVTDCFYIVSFSKWDFEK